MVASISYSIQCDLDRTGDYSSPIADITRYVKGTINLQWGIQTPYDEVSQPARMTFTVTNIGSEFSREYLGAERITNGGFDNWTGNIPDGWSTTETPVFSFVRQCAPDKSVTGGGLGACGITWSTAGSAPTLIQSGVFLAGKTYRISVPITYVGSIDTQHPLAVGLYVRTDGDVDLSPVITTANDHVFYKFISPGQSQIKFMPAGIASSGYGADCTMDNISVKEAALYRQLDKSVLIRLRATYLGTTTTIWEGKISDLAFSVGSNAEPTVTITAEDAMLQLLDKEFTPALETSVTADTIISNMLNKGDIFAYPYAKGYWMLGVEGSSELGLTTYLVASAPTSFETGIHVFPYAGDAADRGNGINAQQYIRDVIAAEVGRFYWDARNSEFVLHNRQHDTLNDVSQVKATFQESDLDSVSYVYGQELVNQLTVEFTARTVGGADSIIWSASGLPILLKQNTQRKINARYFDATDNTLKIGATSFTPIRQGVDIIANLASNGSSTDMSDSVIMWADSGATGATVYISNGTTQDIYVTTLQLRGTPLTSKQDTYDTLDGTSRRGYDFYPKVLSVPLMDDPDDAKNFADYQVARFKDPLARLASITFTSLRNTTTLDAAQNRVIGDRITVMLNNGHDADYFIVGESRTITIGGDKPAQITWTLEPAQRKLFWVLGLAGQSELGTTTILGF